MIRLSHRAALAATLLTCLPMSAQARPITPPPVPANLELGSDHKPYLVAHAVGTQNYVCLPSATTPGVAWVLFGPQATILDDRKRQIMTHFLSANPEEHGLARATWLSQDGSAVWAARIDGSSDPAYVDPNAIPWLLLRYVGVDEGPRNGRRLVETSRIHRVNTVGGKAPATGCVTPEDIGQIALVPYEADYIFYKAVGGVS